MNVWLGGRRGFLTDWTTQQWVRATGRRVEVAAVPWLRGPAAPPTGLRDVDFEQYAAEQGLIAAPRGDEAGLLDSIAALRSERFDPAAVRPEIADFYTRTSRYRLHLWSHWSPAFRPFGKAIDAIFARRLGQLQLPLEPLETSRGITSELIPLRDEHGTPQTAWLRRRRPEREVIFAGLYGVDRPPLAPAPCVKVSFPLPNGRACVFFDPIARPDGSIELASAARRFGEAGFYFVVVRDAETAWARHVPQLTERIHVYVDEAGEVHTDHVFRFWGRVFLRLHYAMLPAA